MKHDLQESTLQLVLFMLDLSPNSDLVNLVGPTGVGKSLLQTRLITCIREDARMEMLADPDYVPVIRTHALAAGHKLFDWKSLYRGGLVELGDPFAASRKAVPGASKSSIMRFAHAGESRTASELRMYLETELRARRTKVWIIDEAQHLVFGGRSGCAGDQFDVLKSIAQSTGVKLLLAGPHEMEAGLGSSGQLARRSVTVHYPRYRHENPDHLKTFVSVMGTLFHKMDIVGHPAVREHAEFLYGGSAGCVGIAKGWLARAYGLALRDQQEGRGAVLTLDHLRTTRLSMQSMTKIMNDIRLEEESLVTAASDEDFARIVTGPRAGAIQGGMKVGQRFAKGHSGRVGIRAAGPRDRVPTEQDKNQLGVEESRA